MLLVRQWHTYIGALIAPSVIFFALTGSLQLFSLHEAHGTYHPPPFIQELSSVHKDQLLAAERQRQRVQPVRRDVLVDRRPGREHSSLAVHTLLLKSFFLVMALGLAISTMLGLCVGLTRGRGRKLVLCLLALGTIVPVALLLL